MEIGESREEGRVGVKGESRRASPPIVPPRRQEQPQGQEFHFNHSPRSSYCFSWHTMARAEFSRTHRNMAQILQCVTHTHTGCTHYINTYSWWKSYTLAVQLSVNWPLFSISHIYVLCKWEFFRFCSYITAGAIGDVTAFKCLGP